VADQRLEPGSVLQLVRDVVALRRRTPDLVTGDYESLASPPGAWVWRRGSNTVVALNLSDDPIDLTWPAPSTQIAISTDRSRDGAPVGGTINLRPWEGVVALVSH